MGFLVKLSVKIVWVVLSVYIIRHGYSIWGLRDAVIPGLSYSVEQTMQTMYVAAVPWLLLGVVMKFMGRKKSVNETHALTRAQRKLLAQALAKNEASAGS